MKKLWGILAALLFLSLTGCVGVDSDRPLLPPDQAAMPLQGGSYVPYNVVKSDKGDSWTRATKDDGSPQPHIVIKANGTNKNYTFTIWEKGGDVEYSMRFFAPEGGWRALNREGDWYILELAKQPDDYFYVLVGITDAKGGRRLVAYEGVSVNCQTMSDNGTLEELGLKKKTWECVPGSGQVNLYGYFGRIMRGKLSPVAMIEQ